MRMREPLLTGLLLFSVGCAGSPDTPAQTLGAVPNSSKVQAVTPQRVIGFYPAWKRMQFKVTQIPWNKLTHLAYAFAIPTADGRIDMSTAPDLDKVTAWAKHHKVKMMLSIGGANGSHNFLKFGSDSIARKRFVGEVVKVVRQYKLDGIDIDWEDWPAGGKYHARGADALIELHKELYAVLKPMGVELSTDVYGSDWQGKNYKGELVNYVDWIHMMVYDASGEWSEKPEHHSSIQQTKEAFIYWENKVGRANRSKLVLAVPFYGKKFSKGHRPGRKVEGIDYVEVLKADPNNSDKDVADLGGFVAYYNGQKTMAEKLRMTKEGGYGGNAIWELTQDSLDPAKSLIGVFGRQR